MKLIKYILLTVLSQFAIQGIYSQDSVDRIWNEIDSINSYVANPAEIQTAGFNRWSYNTTVGTSFSYAPHFGSAMNTYLAPHANFSATNRLSFHTGMIASHSSLLKSYTDAEFPYSKGFNSMSIFVAASYHLTENLVIHGTGTKSLMTFPGEFESLNRNFDDFSLGATYKFGNFSIGASIHSAQNMYIGSPIGFGNNMYGSPLYW